MIKVGLIGCGKIGQVRHLPEYAAHPDCKITALYDINLERAKELAVKYGATAYDSVEALLASDVEAVSVCSSNTSHAEITIAALKAGKHVLCEKPMATTLEDSEAMVAAAKEAGKRLMIGQNQRLAGAHKKAKELIDAGTIGELYFVESEYAHDYLGREGVDGWRADKDREPIIGGACHAIDLLRWIAGDPIDICFS